jgi:hypothetical protein
LVHFTAPCHLCCVLVFTSLFIQLFFLQGRGQWAWGLCWFIPGMAWGILCDTLCSPVHFLNVSQAGLELVSANMGTHLFCQCNVAWRSFVWARGLGWCSFDYFWYLISAKCGSSLSAIFLIYGVHAICFCTLVSILDPPWCLEISWVQLVHFG